jgi:predicted alternative tryptophan synthase beta-subunit
LRKKSVRALDRHPEDVRDVLPVAAFASASRPDAWNGSSIPLLASTKYEGVSPAGSHKPNTSVAQAYYNKLKGDPTHHGDWCRAVGSALAMACSFFGLECKVYMVKICTTKTYAG